LNEPIYEALGFFTLRAPLLPIEQYLALASRPVGVDEVEALFSKHSQIARAIVLGNPALFEAFERAKISLKDIDKVVSKILRLLIRMSSRPTPFGMYAGISVGSWSNHSDLVIASEPASTATRLDSEFAAKLALSMEQKYLKSLLLFANPAVSIRRNRVYLLEKAPTLNELDVDGLSIQATPEIVDVLKLAHEPAPYSRLAEVLGATGMTEEDAHGILSQLVETTFLLTNLRASAVEAAAPSMMSALSDIAECGEKSLLFNMAKNSALIDKSIDTIDTSKLNTMVREGGDVVSTAAGMGLQTDTALSTAGGTLNKAVATAVSRMVELLIKLGCVESGALHIADYRDRFLAKYDHREAPCLELLNQDVGLGLPNSADGQRQAPIDAKKQRVMNGLVHKAIRNHQFEIVLDDAVIESLSDKPPSRDKLPSSLDAFVTILASSLADLDAGRFVIASCRPVAGAGRNLGRFADLAPLPVPSALAECDKAEQAVEPDAVIAEVCSIPRTLRVANVRSARHARGFEIPVHSGSKASNAIGLDDLLVGVENGRFYVRSLKLGCRVRTSVTNLMNAKFDTAIARFLGDVSKDGILEIVPFSWGAASQSVFLPRLRYDKFIISPARWHLSSADIPIEPGLPAEKFSHWLAAWRTEWFVPRYVYLTQGDNRLLLDLDNSQHRDELRLELSAVKQHELIQLEEAFCQPEQLWLQGEDGHFVSELVVPLIKGPSATNSSESAVNYAFDPQSISIATRIKPPGQIWVFAKFYCGQNLADDLISGPLLDLSESIAADRLSRLSFFMRYGDPDSHVRQRFLVKDSQAADEVYRRICQLGSNLIAEELCTRLTFDTYDREIERYGGPEAIDSAECLFAADSEAVAKLIKLDAAGQWQYSRIVTAAATSDRMLTSLGLDPAARVDWYRNNDIARNESGADYRLHKDELMALFVTDKNAPHQPLDAILAEWKSSLSSVGAKYNSLNASASLSRDLLWIYRSFVHMHCNRLGLNNQQEAQAISLAHRAADAVKARNMPLKN